MSACGRSSSSCDDRRYAFAGMARHPQEAGTEGRQPGLNGLTDRTVTNNQNRCIRQFVDQRRGAKLGRRCMRLPVELFGLPPAGPVLRLLQREVEGQILLHGEDRRYHPLGRGNVMDTARIAQDYVRRKQRLQ